MGVCVMADTIGGLIDKLFTVDMKMWTNQELLYEIRRMTLDEFREKYFETEDGCSKLYECLKRCCDLNVQRSQLIDEIDEKVVAMIAQDGNLDDGKNIQRKHKTY